MKSLFCLCILFAISNCAALSSLNSVSTSSNTVSTSLNSVSSISDSVKSISGSLQSISGSISGAKTASDKLYIEDIALITKFYLNEKDSTEFKNEINQLALKNGIYNWQKNSLTYQGIGLGLKKGKLSDLELQNFLDSIRNVHPDVKLNIQNGFRS